MEMPRRCSSSKRSVSVPVMYRTSVVLPWSTCPAVPMVSAVGRSSTSVTHRLHHRLLVLLEKCPYIEPQPLSAHAANYRRVRRAQLLEESLGGPVSFVTQAHRVGRYLVK